MLDSFHLYPLYANYPVFTGWNQYSEGQFMEDLSYLQQMYPAFAKELQTKINDMLNTMDYEGSLIYDQYPDKLQLERLVSTILTSLNLTIPDLSQKEDNWLSELVTVLLYLELLKRRHKQQKYYFLR